MTLLGSHRARTVAIVKSHRFIGGAKGRRGRLPRQHYPLEIERSYRDAIAGLFARDRVRRMFEPLLAMIPSLMAEARRDATYTEDGAVTYALDAGQGGKVRDFSASVRRQLHDRVTSSAVDSMARQFAQQVSTYQRVQLNRQTKARLGTDVAPSDRKLLKRVDNWAEENTSLITGISDEIAKRVERRVLAAIGAGPAREERLGEELEEEFGFGEKRSALIARDQVGKLYGQFNADRQQGMGVTHFVWRTQMDDRVRSEHEELEGEVFSYDDGGHPTEGFPGEPVNCRCTAEPIFEDIAEEVDE